MTKARYLTGAMGLAVALSGLITFTAANAATTGAQVVSPQSHSAAASCIAKHPLTIPANQDVKGELWYTDNGTNTCIGTVLVDVHNAKATIKNVTVHVAKYQFHFDHQVMTAGWSSHAEAVRRPFYRANFKVCVGASNTPGYACVTVP